MLNIDTGQVLDTGRYWAGCFARIGAFECPVGRLRNVRVLGRSIPGVWY